MFYMLIYRFFCCDSEKEFHCEKHFSAKSSTLQQKHEITNEDMCAHNQRRGIPV